MPGLSLGKDGETRVSNVLTVLENSKTCFKILKFDPQRLIISPLTAKAAFSDGHGYSD